MTPTYVLAEAAEQDLLEIGRYIAETDSLERALKVLDDLQAAIVRLGLDPLLGHRRADLTDRSSYRFWRVHSFLIVYHAEQRPIGIARVLRGTRDVRRILS